MVDGDIAITGYVIMIRQLLITLALDGCFYAADEDIGYVTLRQQRRVTPQADKRPLRMHAY